MSTLNKAQQKELARKAFERLSGDKPFLGAWIKAWQQVASDGAIDATGFNDAVFYQIDQNALSQQATHRLHLENKLKFGKMIMDELTAARIQEFVPTAWTPTSLQFVYLLSSGEHTKHQIPS